MSQDTGAPKAAKWPESPVVGYDRLYPSDYQEMARESREAVARLAERPQRRDRQKKGQPQLVDVPSTKPAGWTSDCWGTPPEMVREMEAEFGPFELDPCATPETAKAPKFYTVFDNGLLLPWRGRVWLNPPYSDPTPWLQRAVAAQEDGCLVVALLPASTDANWFHDLVLPNAEVRFIRQRVRFIGWRGTPIPSPIAPNLWAIFHPKERHG
jgi:phage N-6-adenine-methyltransferase